MMKKTKYMSNAQRNEYFDNSPTQKKEDKNNSLISFHENMNLHNIYKSGTSIINIPSNISSRAQILPSNYPITPLRSVNHIISSSNRNICKAWDHCLCGQIPIHTPAFYKTPAPESQRW